MTELDHSSLTSLLSGLDRHRNGVFRFRYIADYMTSSPWVLNLAIRITPGAVRPDGGVRLHIAYVDPVVNACSANDLLLRLAGGKLTYADSADPMTVVVEDGLPGAPDDSRRLDGNLRGVFS